MSVSANTCDPIVVGFGIGGGWAAKELTGFEASRSAGAH